MEDDDGKEDYEALAEEEAKKKFIKEFQSDIESDIGVATAIRHEKRLREMRKVARTDPG